MLCRKFLLLFCLTASFAHLQCSSMPGHAEILQQFVNLQHSVGISSSQADMARVDKVVGKHGDQGHFNTVRYKLNTLLSQDSIDVDKVQQKIKQLAQLNPARWPRPSDYSDLLKAKLAAQKGGKAQAKNEAPPLPTMEELQQQFAQLERNVGLKTSAAKMKEVHKVHGRQGTSDQFATVRVQLNYLISQIPLRENDVLAKIKELAGLNPARWPRAEDYSALLKATSAFNAAVVSIRKQLTDRLMKASLNDADVTFILDKIKTLETLAPTNEPKAAAFRKVLDEKLGHHAGPVDEEEELNEGAEGQPSPRAEGR